MVLNLEFGKDNFIVINMYIPPSENIEDYLAKIELLLIRYSRKKNNLCWGFKR